MELVPKNIPLSIVPQVMGMGAKDAVAVLENRGLNVAISGFGKVVKQSITAGQPINGGETIIIYLE